MLSTYVKLTPVTGGPALTLSGPDDIQRDALGNVTFSWRDPLKGSNSQRLTVSDLEGYLCSGVDVKKNRVGALEAITDAGGALLTVEWTEFDIWRGATLGPYTLPGVAALSGGRSAVQEDGLTLVVYKAYYRWERGTGTFEESI